MSNTSSIRALPLLFALAACGPLVQIGGNAKPPVSLLMLRATATPGPAVPTGATIGVEVPSVPGPLQTLRLPVVTTDTEVTYLAAATWAEQPNKQFQRVLSDTLAARGLQVVDLHQSGVAPARHLSGQLMEFGIDVRNPAAPVVRVRFDAQLTAPLRLQRFDASEPLDMVAAQPAAAALNRAANRVAGQVADWAAR